MGSISEWLLNQAPVIVVLGGVIYWLQAKLGKAETDKDSLARDVIKLTTLWEEKNNTVENNTAKIEGKILDLLREIKNLVSKN